MLPHAIHDRRLALLILLTNDDDYDESCWVVGRATWDGRHIGLDTPDGERFLIPNDRLAQVQAVPEEVGPELEDAELFVVLDDLTTARARPCETPPGSRPQILPRRTSRR